MSAGQCWRCQAPITLPTTGPHARQVADPFHVVRLANHRLDEVRRRVQNETLGHRGRKRDPLYGARRLTKAHGRISDRGQTRLLGLLEAGDPHGKSAWGGTSPKPSEAPTPSTPRPSPSNTPTSSPPTSETNHAPPTSTGSAVSSPDGPLRSPTGTSPESPTDTEALNNLIKRIKRIAFGLPNFANYRIRALLHAGKPNRDLPATVTPHRIPMSRLKVPIESHFRSVRPTLYPTESVECDRGAPAGRTLGVSGWLSRYL